MAKITRMIASTCHNGPCPTTYELDDGDFLFQGYEEASPKLLAGLDVAPGETFIRVPRALALEFLRKAGL